MIAPSTSPPFFPYRIETEMLEFDAEFVPRSELPAVQVPTEPKAEGQGRLRAIARGQYLENGGGLLRNLIAGARGRGSSAREVGIENEDIGRADVPDDMKPHQ